MAEPVRAFLALEIAQAVKAALAAGVRSAFSSDWGIGITGIAGPSGGTADKPVGLVHWAVAGPAGVAADHRVFSGDRPSVRLWSAHVALDLLRRQLALGRRHD